MDWTAVSNEDKKLILQEVLKGFSRHCIEVFEMIGDLNMDAYESPIEFIAWVAEDMSEIESKNKLKNLGD